MALHQAVQRVLLIGARLHTARAPAIPAPPARLQPIIDALAPLRSAHDAKAIRLGHRYRSGFWAIYLLSAFAVLCAMMPLALGWDDLSDPWHPLAPAWVVAEILVITAIAIIFWRGHRTDWQGGWLRARTLAELTGYLPLTAPLVDFSKPGEASWYSRAGLSGPHATVPPEIAAACAAQESRAREQLTGAWSDAAFVESYAHWAIGIFESQRTYHAHVARRSHVLQHRIHRATAVLFGLTAIGALAHLVIHSRWISLITTVFPALAAALHGALAQSELFRMEAASDRMAVELGTTIEAIRSSLSDEAARVDKLRAATREALALILKEHQDWTMLVKPHHLPLA